MNTNKYSFPDFIDDDNLSILAVRAKDMLENYKNVVQIFETNKMELYGDSPSQTMCLMKLNNKSIFSSSPSSGSSPTGSKPQQGLLTPVKRKLKAMIAARRRLELGDEDNKVHHSTTLETSTAVLDQKVTISSIIQMIIDPPIDETTSKDKQFIPPTDSTHTIEAGNLECSLSVADVKMTASLSLAEKDFQSPEKDVGTFSQENQETPQYTEITEIVSSSAVDDKKSKSLIEKDQMVVASSKSEDSTNLMEKDEKSDKSDSPNKYSICDTEGIGKDSKSTGDLPPRPAKRSRMDDSSNLGIQELERPEKVRKVVSSSEDTVANVSPISGFKTKKPPNKASKDTSSSPQKMKFNPPKKTWMLRINELGGKTKFDVEVSSDSEDPEKFESSPSDSTSDSKIDNTGDIKLKTRSPRKIFNWTIPLPEAQTSTANVSTAGSDNSSVEKDLSCAPSTSATGNSEKSSESEASSADMRVAHIQDLNKFNSLLYLRNHTMEKMLSTFVYFRNSINFLYTYVRNARHIALNIYASDENYITEELKEIIKEVNTMGMKLETKLMTRETEANSDVETFEKYLQTFKTLKEDYDIFTVQSKEPVTVEDLQWHELEFMTIWKKMDEMIILGDSQRPLFFQMEFEIEKVMNKLIKCLVLVGILLPS